MEFADIIKIPKLDGVVLTRPFHGPVDGTLCITAHHLIFSSRREVQEELWILHHAVDIVVSRPNNPSGGTILLKCKDLRILSLEVPGAENHTSIAYTLETLCNISEPTLLYPFFHRSMYTSSEEGWSAFLPEVEYSKMIANHLQDWRLCHINSEFRVCASYPTVVCVPKAVDDKTVVESALFRHGGRFPILCYLHNGNVALLRSSQPMIGPQSKRNKGDERILSAVLSTHAQMGQRGYIVDTRTQSAAHSARSKGGGFEMETFYPQWRRMFKGLERKSALMDCLVRLVEACNDTSLSSDKWLGRLESSGWLSYIADALMTACLVSQCIEVEGASVLVHGSEGTDSTLLVTSLAQLLLNPKCRTIRGFQALIELEWVLGGHPFRQRHAKCAYAPASSGKGRGAAPYFIVFLDCVWQVMQQFPTSFEFREDFLLILLDHTYASQFGTFLANSPRERSTLNLSERTGSLWSHLNTTRTILEVKNPLYVSQDGPLWPSVAPVTLELCSAIFLRWIQEPGPRKDAVLAVFELKEKENSLRSQAARLREEIRAVLLPEPKTESKPETSASTSSST